jgi:hypothetical protein
MSEVKYICFETPVYEIPSIIMFPAWIEHRKMVQSLDGKILSAGFARLPDALNPEAFCYGQSTSLNLWSRPEDTVILRKMLGLAS